MPTGNNYTKGYLSIRTRAMHFTQLQYLILSVFTGASSHWSLILTRPMLSYIFPEGMPMQLIF